jgi:hypothetical protein
MEEFLRNAPRALVAVGAIVIGFILIVMFNPPRTVCDEQLDVFRQSQKAFLYSASNKVKKSVADELFSLCKSSNEPGGCFDLFLNLRTMAESLERMPKQCGSRVSTDDHIKKWIFKSLTLMVQIAWGEENPGVYVSRKHGWLDASDFRLYCQLKNLAVRFYGQDGFETFRESVMSSLPGAEKMSREQKWSRSIFSSPCE